jgi:hypothetical protein|nr:MAG TPA: hypothetical protein [Caudoviricetes sp.]
MEIKFDYTQLEQKYGITVKYPRNNKVTFRNKCMAKMRNTYAKIRKKTKNRIPLTEKEEIYLGAEKGVEKLKKNNESFIETEHPYYKIEFIHMVDYIPKENMEKFRKEINKFKKKHIAFNYPTDETETEKLGEFMPGCFIKNQYSMGIKKTSPLYKYISGIYIGFQELTTSLNTVIYTIQLKEDIVKSMNEIFLAEFKDYYYWNDSNLKWFEFWKIGWSYCAGDVYKQTFINDYLESLKWNILKILRRALTVYLAEGNAVLPSVNAYKTNIDGNTSPQFWCSINVKSPKHCDFFKNHSGCINWENGEESLDYIYRKTGRKDWFALSMDIKYYYSQYLIRNTIIKNTYAKVGKYMATINSFNTKYHPLKKWLSLKTDAEKGTLYYKRFYNEQKPTMYDSSDFDYIFENINNGIKGSISKDIIRQQCEEVQSAGEVLKQTLEYIDTNIEYRSSKENYRIQRNTLNITFLSMIVATLALVVSCITNENVCLYILTNWVQIVKVGIVFLIIWIIARIIINQFRK